MGIRRAVAVSFISNINPFVNEIQLQQGVRYMVSMFIYDFIYKLTHQIQNNLGLLKVG